MKWSILVASIFLSCLVISAHADVVGSTELLQLERFASHRGHYGLFGPAHSYGAPSRSGGCCEYVHSYRDHVWDGYCSSQDSHGCETEPLGHHSCDLGGSQWYPAPMQCVSRCDRGFGPCGGRFGLLRKLLFCFQCNFCPGAGSSCDSCAVVGCDGSAIDRSVHDHTDYDDGTSIQDSKPEKGIDIPPAPSEVTPPEPVTDAV